MDKIELREKNDLQFKKKICFSFLYASESEESTVKIKEVFLPVRKKVWKYLVLPGSWGKVGNFGLARERSGKIIDLSENNNYILHVKYKNGSFYA